MAKRPLLRYLISALLGVVAASGASQAASAQRFWFGPQDPVAGRTVKNRLSNDYLGLFLPGSPWGQGASRLSVFKVNAQFVLDGTDQDIRTVFNGMAQRHVKMAIEMGTVVRLDSCGLGEGYAPQGMADRIGSRLSTIGVHLDYIDADEPVWFTHEVNWGTAAGGRPNCMYPLNVVADRTMISVNAIRKYFPDIALGETEVVEAERFAPTRTAQDYAEFARLIQVRGEKLAFFHADIAWRHNPMPTLVLLRQAMQAEGVPFGAILGGGLEDTNGPQWVQNGLQRLVQLQRNPATHLDQIVIQSWQPLPNRVLPETQPGTFTYFLAQAERLAGPK